MRRVTRPPILAAAHVPLWRGAYEREVYRDTPVLYYPTNEQSGTNAANMGTAGAAGDGTYTGTVTLNQDGLVRGGRSVRFGGSGTPGRILSAHTTDYTAACTLEAVIVPEASGQGDGVGARIWDKCLYYAQANLDFPISLNYSTTNGVTLRLSQGGDFTVDLEMHSGALTALAEYYVAAVYRASGSCEVWIEDVMVAQSTIAFAINARNTIAWGVGGSTPFSVGAGDSAFNGLIGNAALYGSALSADRIRAHARARRV